MSPGRVTTTVTEIATDDPPGLSHAGWRVAFPWLVQGTTTRGSADTPFDLGLFSGGSPRAAVERNWADLLETAGMSTAVHAQQVHGADVGVAPSTAHAGLVLVDDRDGHVTAAAGVLLAVTAADCVPLFLVDPANRAVAMVHAGWRSAAGGILERAVGLMGATFGTRPSGLHVHLGPAICGDCYEVGPEVFGALGLPQPSGPTPIDLRAALSARAVETGVPAERVSVSSHCTRCTDSGLFSHRGGDRGRHVGFLGVRPR